VISAASVLPGTAGTAVAGAIERLIVRMKLAGAKV